MSWTGGSLLGSQSTFPKMCISAAMYDELGPAVVHSMCGTGPSGNVAAISVPATTTSSTPTTTVSTTGTDLEASS